MTRGTKRATVSGPVLKQIGANVLRVRKSADLTQAAAAELAGVDQSTLSRIEKGSYPGLDFEHVVRLSRAFQCSLPDELLFGLDMAMTIVGHEQGAAA